MWVILYVYLKDTVLMIELVYYLLNLKNLGEFFGTHIMWTCTGTPLRWLTSGKHLMQILFLY
jgi:hypothetical protein